jgi:4-hydroxybenzoate polyprenyltransferase
VITYARLVLLLARPAVLMLLSLYAAIGVARAGDTGYDHLAPVLLAVFGFLLFSVAVNDLADEPIDRVNLAGDNRRPLVTGAASRPDMVLLAVAAAACALAAAAWLGSAVLIATAAGLTISYSYSVRPIRIAERGAVAALVLPACYVVVPYLDGLLAAGGRFGLGDGMLLSGLYVGFIGRILLKDFRDVRGDVLFGKRTFLVRHGRIVTCRASAGLWLAGAALVSVAQHAASLTAGYGLSCVAAIALLRGLAGDAHPRHDELRIAALAIIGRGMLIALLAQLAMSSRDWPAAGVAGVLGWLTVVTAVQARSMLHNGPRPRLTSAVLRHITPTEPQRVAIVAE